MNERQKSGCAGTIFTLSLICGGAAMAYEGYTQNRPGETYGGILMTTAGLASRFASHEFAEEVLERERNKVDTKPDQESKE